MAPSRGADSPPSSPLSDPAQSLDETDLKANARSTSALASAKLNLRYLYDPHTAASAGARPAHFRTRALLRSLRYIGIFVFWRIVRYARYALVGTLVAAVGASAVGSGAAFVLAPPTIASSIGIGIVWAVGKWGFRKMKVGERVEQGGVREVEESRRDVFRREGQWHGVQGPESVPW